MDTPQGSGDMRCLIAFGGNVGDVPAAYRAVQAAFSTRPDLTLQAASRLYTTAPVGSAAGGEYLNGALVVETGRDPAALLSDLQSIEAHLGRQRHIHWGPRTVDLDLILADDAVIETPQLTVPHPAAWYRRFVLDPACEVAADWWHPRLQESLGQLRSRLLPRPLEICVTSSDAQQARVLAETLAVEFAHVAQVTSPAADAAKATAAATPVLTLSCSPSGAAPVVPSLRIVPLSVDDNGMLSAARFVVLSATDEPRPVD